MQHNSLLCKSKLVEVGEHENEPMNTHISCPSHVLQSLNTRTTQVTNYHTQTLFQHYKH